ncbi:MAG: EAL domain-containing protein [Candidatus Dormibacteria bacterium]|jgi:diguanylate cyclase (GGDEF)-like protein/PAS domain S-box-containing protein
MAGLPRTSTGSSRDILTRVDVFELAPFGMMITDRDGRFRRVNPAFARLVGRSAEELIGATFASLTSPDDVETSVTALRDLLAGRVETAQLEKRYLRADGSLVWVDMHIRSLLGDDARVAGFVAECTDITDRKRSEEALVASEEHFRELVQNSNDLISVFGPEGRRLYDSPAACRIYGLPQDGVPATFDALIHEDDLARMRGLWAELLAGTSGTRPVRYRIRHGDGTVHHLESTARNALNHPAVGGLIVNTRDVTEEVASREALEASEERFRELVQNSSDVITVHGRDGHREYSSPGASTLYGVAMDELPANAVEAIFPEDRSRMREVFRRVEAQPGLQVTERFRIPRPDGELREVEATLRNALDNPQVRGIVTNTRDITDKARAEALLATQTRILTMIASGSMLEATLAALASEVEDRLPVVRCAIQRLRDDGTVEVIGTEPRDTLACALMDGNRLDAEGSLCGAVVHRDAEMLVPDPADSRRWGTAPCLSGTTTIKACWVTPLRRGRNGEPVGAVSCHFPRPYTPDDAARRLVATIAELAAVAIERRRFEDQLSYQALHDPLTGLANRALLIEHLASEGARAGRAPSTGAVLYLDLDRFKIVNDSFGHRGGDLVLLEMAKRMSAEVRAEDTVARLGGDEFVISCPDVGDHQNAIRLADRLLQAISRPFKVRGQELRLTASIGITLRSARDRSPDTLVRNADAAMYRAKEHGRDRWELFDASLRQRALERLRTESALRQAVENHDFEVWYQPVWSAAEDRIVAIEALARWRQEGGRLALPGEFIALAEETRLISRLGAWVLGRACDDLSTLEGAGMASLQVSVNASARQLVDGSLVPAVERALAASGLTPERLVIELTETALLSDAKAASRTVRSLQELGVGIALDDFGTGFSSLSLVKQFPEMSVIKIDRSFVGSHGVPGPIDRAIISASLALADAQGADVIAEGVETPEQLAALLQLGVTQLQGYLIARPMPLAELRIALVSQPWRAALREAVPGGPARLRIACP